MVYGFIHPSQIGTPTDGHPPFWHDPSFDHGTPPQKYQWDTSMKGYIFWDDIEVYPQNPSQYFSVETTMVTWDPTF